MDNRHREGSHIVIGTTQNRPESEPTRLFKMFDLDWKEIKHLVYAALVGLAVKWLSDHSSKTKNDAMIQRINTSDGAAPWSATELIPSGVPGTMRTLYVMGALVKKAAGDQYVRQVASRIVAGCRGHDFQCEVKATFEFVRDQITYRRDPVAVERVQDAQRTLEFGSGDCDDKVVLLASLLAALGHRSRFVVIGYNRDSFSHVYLEVLCKGAWIPLDPTNEQAAIGWEAQAAIRQAYPIWVI